LIENASGDSPDENAETADSVRRLFREHNAEPAPPPALSDDELIAKIRDAADDSASE
jgi:hypothetical protein